MINPFNNGRDGDSETPLPRTLVVSETLIRPEEGPDEIGPVVPVPERIPTVPDPGPAPDNEFAWVDNTFGPGFVPPPPGPYDPILAGLQQSRVTQFDDILNFSLSPQPILIDSFAGNDRIIGSVFGDNIQTGAGDDTVLGGPGDDELDGDSGFDTAVYKGSILDYNVIWIDGDEVDVVDMSASRIFAPATGTGDDQGIPLDEGTDELEDFEAIRFADYTLRLDGVNNAPFVVADDLVITENTSADLFFNVYEFDGDPVTVDSIDSENGATINPILTIVPIRALTFFGLGTQFPYEYTPVASTLVAGETLSDTVTFTVTDGPPILIGPIFPGPGPIPFPGPIPLPGPGPIPLPIGPATTTVTVNVTIMGVNDPLTANDDTATVVEDGSVGIDVLANDTSDGGETLFVRQATAANGAVEIQENGEIHYTPNSNFNGSDTITYTIWNGTETSFTDTAEVDLTVTPVNDPPDAVADRVTTNEDVPVNIDVLANDTDLESDKLTVTAASAPNGTVVIEADNTLTYTPNLNFNGREQITYTISDGNGGTDTGFVAVTVDPVNDDPTGVTDIAPPIPEDGGPIVFDVLANDFDVDGDSPLFVSALGIQVGGTAELTNDGQIRFTPDKDFFGSGIVQYFIGDGNGGTGQGVALFPVTNVNDAPTTNPGDIVAEEDDGLITIQLKDFVNDVDNDILSFLEISADRDGDLIPFSIRDDRGQFQTFENGIITIDPELLGLDSGESAMTTFTYTVNDNSGDPGKDTATGTIDVKINGADEPVVGPTFDGVTDLIVNADEEDGPVKILLSDLVTAGSASPNGVLSLLTDDFRGLGSLGALSPITIEESPDGPVLTIALESLYVQGGPTEVFPPVAGDGVLSEGEMETQVLTIGITSADGAFTTATVTLNLTGDTPGADSPTNQPPTGGGTLGDVRVDDPANTTLTFDLDDFASDDYFETNPTDSPLVFTIGSLRIGGEDSGYVVTYPNLTFDNFTNIVTVNLPAVEFVIDDGGSSIGVLDFTISDGTFIVSTSITANFLNPFDTPPDPVMDPDSFILDFEEFSAESGPSLPVSSSKGFLFSGQSTVVETDEIGGERAPGGTASGQTTDPGGNVLVVGPTTITTSEPVLDPDSGAPLRDEEGNPLVTETTVVDKTFAIRGPGSSSEIGDTGVFLGQGATATPPALPVDPPEEFGHAFDLNSLSLNPSIGEGVVVTMKTYVLGVVGEPNDISPGSSTFWARLVEQDSFDFMVDASTPALEIDFDAITLPGGIANPDPTVFDDLFAVEFTTADGTPIVLDDISLSLAADDAVPI